MPGGPRLSQAGGELLRKIRIVDEYGDERVIEVPVERPLSICLDGQIVATLWTLGASAEWLVMGYLWTRRFVSEVTSVGSISIDWALGVPEVKTRDGFAPAQWHSVPPWLDLAGQIGTDPGGTLLIGDELRLAPLPLRRVTRSTLLAILQYPLQNDAIYGAAGSVSLSGIPTIISRKGATALCCDLAERLGMTLFGHAAKGRLPQLMRSPSYR